MAIGGCQQRPGGSGSVERRQLFCKHRGTGNSSDSFWTRVGPAIAHCVRQYATVDWNHPGGHSGVVPIHSRTYSVHLGDPSGGHGSLRPTHRCPCFGAGGIQRNFVAACGRGRQTDWTRYLYSNGERHGSGCRLCGGCSGQHAPE